MSNTSSRRGFAQLVSDLLALRNLVLLAVGAASAFGFQLQTTGSQLARLGAAVDSVRTDLAEERRQRDVVLRVLCTDVVRDADDRARYGLLCEQIRRLSQHPLPAASGPLLTSWPVPPTSPRPAAWESGPPAPPDLGRRGSARRARHARRARPP